MTGWLFYNDWGYRPASSIMDYRCSRTIRSLLLPLVCLLAVPVLAQSAGPLSATVIPQNKLVQPEQLNRELAGHAAHPLILQVGSHTLFEESHIAGAEYAGPAAEPAGLSALRTRVEHLPRTQSIVIYCGCCPWDHCPNIAPAWRLLHSMGFTHVRALYLANNFGTDWVSKGYQVGR